MKESSKPEKSDRPRNLLLRKFFNLVLGGVFLPVFLLVFLGTFLWGWLVGGDEEGVST